jgi:hypothetical protein
MSSFLRWLRGQFGGAAPRPHPHPSESSDTTADLLARARALTREGKLHDASRLYSQLCRKLPTGEVLLEHATLLLDIGDRFGAASAASSALEKDPTNAGALAVQREVLRLEEEDRRR